MTFRHARRARDRASGRRALAVGIAAVGVYVAAASFSGHLSPLARRPLLDGLIPPAPYRWVVPPPELAATNVEPSSATALVELGNRGSATSIVSTDDAQVTLVLPRGSFGTARDQRNVRVRIEPLAPDVVEPPEAPLRLLGNVYRLRAIYEPSGDPARLGDGARVVLVYPFISTDHSEHAVVVSPDGESWTAVDTNDFRSIQQADGPIGTLGYVAVAQTGVTASPTAGAEEGGVDVATIVIVVGLVALAAGAALALRPARSPRERGGRQRQARGKRGRSGEGTSTHRGGRSRPRRASSRPGRGAARGSRRNR